MSAMDNNRSGGMPLRVRDMATPPLDVPGFRAAKSGTIGPALNGPYTPCADIKKRLEDHHRALIYYHCGLFISYVLSAVGTVFVSTDRGAAASVLYLLIAVEIGLLFCALFVKREKHEFFKEIKNRFNDAVNALKTQQAADIKHGREALVCIVRYLLEEQKFDLGWGGLGFTVLNGWFFLIGAIILNLAILTDGHPMRALSVLANDWPAPGLILAMVVYRLIATVIDRRPTITATVHLIDFP